MDNQFAGFVCLLVGAASGAYFFWSLSKSKRLSKWIVTEGTVLESKLLPFGDSFEPYVKYQYAVRGENFVHDKFMSFSIVCEYSFLAKKHLKPYPVGKTVKVYFDRNNPQDAVLEKQEAISQYVLRIVLSLIFIIGGIVLLFQK
jgi:Protein of unknown function (DUF3592)